MATGRARAVYSQLYQTFQAVDRAHERWLATLGSNGARYAVLAALAEAGRPITPSDISDGTGRSPNAISPLLRGLQEEGLIKRAPNASDRRSHFLSLTPVGKRLAQRLQKEEDAFISSVMGRGAGKELDTLERALGTIAERAARAQRVR